MSSFRVRHNCPQCGAQIEFAETDHFLVCPFCDVRNYMWTAQYFRFLFEPKVQGDDVVYVPYLHFKGNAFFTLGLEIKHKVLEFSALGSAAQNLPLNLGFKAQTHKLTPIHSMGQAPFLRFDHRPADLLRAACNATTGPHAGCHTFIGELLSLIYFPMVRLKGALYDGLTGLPLGGAPKAEEMDEMRLVQIPKPDLNFLPAICPHCGSPMGGEGRSVVLVCDNCYRAWEPMQGRYVERPVFSPKDGSTRTKYLPFWKLEMGFEGVQLDTWDDFCRLSNQRPRAQGRFYFWTPAFKINAQTMLRTAGRLTMEAKDFQDEPRPPTANHHPITLPSSEAGELTPMVLASLIMGKKDFFPRLSGLRCAVQTASIHYLPFDESGDQFVNTELNHAISGQALTFGQRL